MLLVCLCFFIFISFNTLILVNCQLNCIEVRQVTKSTNFFNSFINITCTRIKHFRQFFSFLKCGKYLPFLGSHIQGGHTAYKNLTAFPSWPLVRTPWNPFLGFHRNAFFYSGNVQRSQGMEIKFRPPAIFTKQVLIYEKKVTVQVM